jgi:hypothetical protein
MVSPFPALFRLSSFRSVPCLKGGVRTIGSAELMVAWLSAGWLFVCSPCCVMKSEALAPAFNCKHGVVKCMRGAGGALTTYSGYGYLSSDVRYGTVTK